MALLCVAAMVSFAVPVRSTTFWSLAVAVAGLAALLSLAVPAKLWGPAAAEFLCDRCKYQDARDCSRPERPNAKSCPDFRVRSF